MKKLHPPQERHVQRMLEVLERNKSAADLSPCGLGKTVCAAEVARLIERPLFVVAPLSTLPAWREELSERGVPAVVTNYEQLRSKKNGWCAQDRAGRWSWTLPLDTIICWDEAQKLKSVDSLISKIGISSKPYTTMLLSGSIAENPAQLRTTGYLLGLHHLRDFLPWAKLRGCTLDFWRKLQFNDDAQVLHRLHHDIIPQRGSQMTYAEMKQFLPDNRVIFEAVDFGDKGAIAHYYAEMAVELTLLAGIIADDKKGAEALTAQLRARQQTELLKVPLLAERADALAAEGHSVIVFLAYAASLDALSERLGGIPIIDGRHGDRETVIQDFRADRSKIIGVNVAAGGAGISLHGKRPRRTILAPDFNPIHVIQALGRAPRVGGSDVIQHVLTARGTVEDGVTTSMKQKLKNLDILNNGLDQPAPVSAAKPIDIPNDLSETINLCQNQPKDALGAVSINPDPSSVQTNECAAGSSARVNCATEPPPETGTPKTGLLCDPAQPNGGPTTPAESKNITSKAPSEDTIFPMKNTKNSSRAKAAAAPSAAPNQSNGSPSTTTTPPSTCADSSVPNATPASGCSKTTPPPSAPPPDTLIEPEHAQYNPSSMEMWAKCPGYLNRKDDSNPLAERGTRIHRALETDDLDSLDAEKEKPIAQMCKDFIDGLLADMLPAQPDVDLREVKLHIDLGGGITTFGTVDRAFRFGRKAVVVDYKSGYLEVADAEVNPQAWCYCVGLFQKLTLGFDQIDEIDFYFLIPNRDEISHHNFQRSDVPNMQMILNGIIRRAMAADPAGFTPRNELCTYCARAPRCPALGKKIAALGKSLRAEIEMPANPAVSIDRQEDIPKLLHLAPIVEAWAKEVRAEALRLTLEEGLEIDGFRRQERSVPRSVTSVIGAYDAVKDKISLDDFLLSCSKVSIPKLEDLFSADAKRGEKKATRQELENRLRAADILRDEGSIFYLREKKA